MKYLIITICLLLFVAGCESQSSYEDPYVNAMRNYIQMADSRDKTAPPPPQPPPEMYAGRMPTPQFRNQFHNPGTSFMQGFSQGMAGGAQAGAIRLQAIRNQAYNAALNHYYAALERCE